ncbi:Tn3 transposase DDE domain-containing protein [Streptomyces sp. SceaMP-e96]|uniref:Tn3 family transposase n=1 Tax=Streptomyces TaxID=1883 RepID=UPI0008238270|nr:Tn3 family transposase [Streptomyces sp. SceaMP-e96]MYT18344.1 Tn3 family transposase [Streptomyces sp. SID4951]SCK54603.1 Tn3 transposase DDE domain-containing protein [Streptomyces sp. SceaMP-e96]
MRLTYRDERRLVYRAEFRRAGRVQKIIEGLRVQGQTVPDNEVRHLSPLMYRHITMRGRFHFELPTETMLVIPGPGPNPLSKPQDTATAEPASKAPLRGEPRPHTEAGASPQAPASPMPSLSTTSPRRVVASRPTPRQLRGDRLHKDTPDPVQPIGKSP